MYDFVRGSALAGTFSELLYDILKGRGHAETRGCPPWDGLFSTVQSLWLIECLLDLNDRFHWPTSVGMSHPQRIQPSPHSSFIFTFSCVTKHQQQCLCSKMAYPHHVFKGPFGLCDWTITLMLNLAQIGTTTFPVYRHACTSVNLSLWLHQEVFRWSQLHWAKQLTLSWQNGFHHSMRIMPLICLLHPSEKQAHLWQLFPVLSGSRNYWNEMKGHKASLHLSCPPPTHQSSKCWNIKMKGNNWFLWNFFHF